MRNSIPIQSPCPVFSLNHVTASYGEKCILSDISFTINPEAKGKDCNRGQLTALLGANGSGKTTLLKVICSQLSHRGTCCLSDTVLETLSLRQRAKEISYIPQRSGITLSLSALEVVLMGFNPHLKILEQPSARMRQEASEALETVGLSHCADRDYLTLSEGEKQLCIFARTLVEHTRLLLLDEPDSALDFANRRRMMMQLRQLTDQYHKTAILCLHDPGLALDYCDQLVLLSGGSISAVLYPEYDSLESMEQALSEIYGPVTLLRTADAQGNMHLVLLSNLV